MFTVVRDDVNSFPHTLHAVPISSSGAVGAPKTVFSKDNKALISNAEALWIRESSSSVSKKKKKGEFGLLFISFLRGWQFYTHDPYDPEIVFAVARFDAQGNVSSFTELYAEKIPVAATGGGAYFKLQIGRGNNVVAVLFDIFYEKTFSSRSWFTVINPAEVPSAPAAFKPELFSIKLPNKGNNIAFTSGRPAWNGARWLAPSYYAISMTNAWVGIVRGVPKNDKFKLKVIKTFQLTGDIFYDDWQFLPETESASPSKKYLGESLKLFYRIGNEATKEFTGAYLQDINGKAKKVGQPVSLAFNAWDRTITPDDSRHFRHWQDTVSPPIPGDNGSVLIGRCRTYWHADYKSGVGAINGEYDAQMDIYSVDPATGKVSVYAKTNKTNMAYFEYQILRWFEGSLSSLIHSRKDGFDDDTYFAEIK
jgi:hypothetical protein